MSVLDKLGDVLGFTEDLVVGLAELYFPDDDSELAYFCWIYFAEVVCDFDDVEGLYVLGRGGVLAGYDA